jgi:glycosyltransferase involved in cell wall biosynthesis
LFDWSLEIRKQAPRALNPLISRVKHDAALSVIRVARRSLGSYSPEPGFQLYIMPAAILHLLGTGQPEGSGIARIVAALAKGLDPSKYHLHAWFLGSSGPLVEYLEAAGAAVESLNWYRGAGDPIGAYRFWRRLRNYDFAVVHQHFGARSVRRIIRMSSDARLVVHLHGRISESVTARSVPVAAQGADVLIAVSHAIANQFPALKPIVVHAGVEPSKRYLSESRASRATTVIGAACRLVPLKGLLNLIRAVASLHSEFPALRLEIAGAGPQRDALEKELNRLGIAGQVSFLGWQPDIRTVFRSWDIFASPSLDEGLPIATLEAMAEGLPIVATSVGGLSELIEDGKTGYLVPPSDVAALTGRLRFLILEPECRQAMGAAGRRRAVKLFSVDRMVAKIAAVYDSLLPFQDGPKK